MKKRNKNATRKEAMLMEAETKHYYEVTWAEAERMGAFLEEAVPADEADEAAREEAREWGMLMYENKDHGKAAQ